MSILTMMQKVNKAQTAVFNGCSKLLNTPGWGIMMVFLLMVVLLTGCGPNEQVVLKQIKEVVIEGSETPRLRAQAVFYNPNQVKMKLKKIDIEVFVNGRKAALINQNLKTQIPAHDYFTVPLEVSLAMKELGFFDTLLGVIGGKKFEVQYKGYVKLNYHGIPIRVPVDYKDNVRVKF